MIQRNDQERAQGERLLELRRRLLHERTVAESPGVARAIELADSHLFLAVSYLDELEELFPGMAAEDAADSGSQDE